MGKVVKGVTSAVKGVVGGLFGGQQQAGPTGPSKEEMRAMAQSHWANYQKWTGDIRTSYERDVESAKARFAAAGAQAGSPAAEMLQAFMTGRKEAYEQEMETLGTGEAATYLRQYMAQNKGTGSLEDFYGRLFGGGTGTGGAGDFRERVGNIWDRFKQIDTSGESGMQFGHGALLSRIGKGGWWQGS